MKGHIFNLFEDFIIDQAGLGFYQDILSCCSFPTDEGFIRTENYPDEKLYELIAIAVKKIGITPREASLSWGEWLLPRLAELVPKEMMDYKHPRDFLKTVDYIHRVELKKLYPDALPPSFSYEDISKDRGVLTYKSHRHLYDLVEGVLIGVASYFHTHIGIRREPAGEGEDEIMLFHLDYNA
ncbi:MAG: heme NO-binding domain-containing protein [Pseudomonadales bacterium]|nr:heme NO-binding domain-containing protein [Pseudomonadales bacterium]